VKSEKAQTAAASLCDQLFIGSLFDAIPSFAGTDASMAQGRQNRSRFDRALVESVKEESLNR